MNPHEQWCITSSCPASGHIGKGNITIHSRKDSRYRCSLCGKTFSARHGTPFYRRRTHEQTIALVISLISHGCPLVAIQHAYGFHPQTIRSWLEAAGTHAETIQHDLVNQPRDLGHVQADEVRVKTQVGIIWMAMAIAVSSRLWLGGVVSTRRDQRLIERLVALIAASAMVAPLLLAVDGFSSYVQAFRRAFRSKERTGKRGAPRKRPWKELCIAQIVKHTHKRRVVEVSRRLVHGSWERAERLLVATPGCEVLNTAYIERLNGTFRARLAMLARRTHHGVANKEVLQHGMYLVGGLYNFCTVHASLRTAAGEERTPAMAAGLTGHCWTVEEFLRRRVPPPRWQPPIRRGRRSKAMQELVEKWAIP